MLEKEISRLKNPASRRPRKLPVCSSSFRCIRLSLKYRTRNYAGLRWNWNPRNALLEQPISRFIINADGDRFYLFKKQLLKDGNAQSVDLRMHRAGGIVFWARLECIGIFDADGASLCRIVLSDIDEQKLAEVKIDALLAEKVLILKEVHHRRKNNMSTLQSVLLRHPLPSLPPSQRLKTR